MQNILFIHGAWSTRTCFNYAVEKLYTDNTIQYFEFDCQTEAAEEILARATKECEELSANGKKTTVVGHSMGGVLALHLAQLDSVENIVTIAAPINGIDNINPVVHYFLVATAPILGHLVSRSKFIVDLKERDFSNNNIDVIVATNGFSIAAPKSKTDGVVSIDSQTLWIPDDAKVHSIHTNHHDVLQHAQTAQIIQEAVDGSYRRKAA